MCQGCTYIGSKYAQNTELTNKNLDIQVVAHFWNLKKKLSNQES
jgi:hypothetical protein